MLLWSSLLAQKLVGDNRNRYKGNQQNSFPGWLNIRYFSATLMLVVVVVTCWWRMWETICVGDEIEMLVNDLSRWWLVKFIEKMYHKCFKSVTIKKSLIPLSFGMQGWKNTEQNRTRKIKLRVGMTHTPVINTAVTVCGSNMELSLKKITEKHLTDLTGTIDLSRFESG